MRGAHIAMDTFEKRAITLHYEGNMYKFKEHKGGLYYLDTNEVLP